MRRFVSLSVSMLLTLLLAAGLLSVTAFADVEVTMPDIVNIEYKAATTEIEGEFSNAEEKVSIVTNGNGAIKNENDDVLQFTIDNTNSFQPGDTSGNLKIIISIDADSWNGAEKGTTYTGTIDWAVMGETTMALASGQIELTAVIPSEDDSSEDSSEPEESSEESSEPEEESSTTEEESSTVEDESSTVEEESSAAESESESASESSQSSKTSKPQNPGKPDELSMGGSIGGASESGKPAPDTGMSYAPLAALGVAAMAGLAVMAFRKK